MINIRQKFACDGQVTFYRAVPEHQANAWRTMARHARGWFSERFNKTFIPESEANDRNWFKMRAGWRELPIVALGDVRFYVYGWNHTVALRSNRTEIMLRKGDIFVYRGDLSFAPVGSETNSVCLHPFLDTPTSDRSPDHQPVIVPALDDTVCSDDPFCFMWNGTFRGSGKLAMRRHLNRFHGFRFHHGASIEAYAESYLAIDEEVAQQELAAQEAGASGGDSSGAGDDADDSSYEPSTAASSHESSSCASPPVRQMSRSDKIQSCEEDDGASPDSVDYESRNVAPCILHP
ncbi:hypothetical protein PHYSODRAFT_338863 [Phytophthora sojae]|uniref:Uncharacterized protein n=1 Tax=Phytophthora sojae (strain P6497) TaxID=1094619 RepID=G5A3H3_PHYSP|nr:hypothetical protein PHYSODRAFT_338863 [Phytophthora sojae]EGZ10189.1 hypothetical protein PHYSODRAFT_338863 [Phytophthora sojae]|eukprot:XP_009535050.1 hypothetical protein PHYSODRAFT_338863 [Phytophthora sojae]